MQVAKQKVKDMLILCLHLDILQYINLKWHLEFQDIYGQKENIILWEKMTLHRQILLNTEWSVAND